jgi:putative transposase
MANTYTQIHIQIVFGVQNRQSLIKNSWKVELHKYITGIVQNKGHKMIILNSMPDHIHILIGLRPIESLSNLVKEIKSQSSKWINDNKLVYGRFTWQQGFGAFSYSKNEIKNVIKYIENQDLHHKKRSFVEEYIKFLNDFDIDYNESYLFHSVE